MAARTIEWITAVGSALAALGTIAAVLVALFGAQWRSARQRPSLTVSSEELSLPAGDNDFAVFVELAIAYDVEVNATATEVNGSAENFVPATDVGLGFGYPEPSAPLLLTTKVAPGHHRTAYLIGIGGKEGLAPGGVHRRDRVERGDRDSRSRCV